MKRKRTTDMDELEVTKAQLERALTVTRDLEAEHVKNRRLVEELAEANQRCDSLQNRLRLSQARCNAYDVKEHELKVEAENMRRECDAAQARCAELESALANAQRIAETAAAERDACSHFIESFNSLVGAQASGFEGVLKAVAKLHEKATPTQCPQCIESDTVIAKLAEKLQRLKAKLYATADELSQRNETLANIDSKLPGDGDILRKIDAIKQKGNEMASEIDALKREVEFVRADVGAKDERIEELKKKALAPPVIETVPDKHEVLKARLESLETQNSKLHETIREKDSKIEELESKVTALDKKLNRNKEKERSQAKEMKHLQKERKICRSQLSELQVAVSEYKTQLTSMQSQIEASQIQPEQPEKLFEERLAKEKAKSKKAIQILVVQTKQQKNEIERLEQERKSLITLLQKQNQALGVLSAFASEQESKKLADKQEPKVVYVHDKGSQLHLDMIRDSLVPRIDGFLKKDIENILKVADSGEKEIVQRVYEVLADSITSLKDEIQSKEQKIQELENKKCESCIRLQSVLRRVLDGFREAQAYQGEDSISEVIKTSITMIEDVMNKTQKDTAANEVAGQLSQMLVTAAMSGKMKVMGEELESLKNERDCLMKMLNCRSQDIIPLVKRLKSKLRKQKHRKHAESKVETRSEKGDDVQNVALFGLIQQQKEEMERLNNEMAVKEKAAETANAQSATLKSQIESMKKKHNQETAQYEKAIECRNKACIELSQKLNQLEGRNEVLKLKIEQVERDFECLLAEEKRSHLQELKKVAEELQDVKQTAVTRYQNQKQKYVARIAKLRQRCESAKTESEMTNDASKRQLEEVQQMCLQLRHSLEESEEENARLTRKLSKARRDLSALAATAQKQKEQSERDMKVSEAQHACQIMQIESQHHEDLIAVRKDLESKTEDLKISVLDAFNELDSFEQREIDDKGFELAIRRLARAHTKA